MQVRASPQPVQQNQTNSHINCSEGEHTPATVQAVWPFHKQPLLRSKLQPAYQVIEQLPHSWLRADKVNADMAHWSLRVGRLQAPLL